MIYIEKKNLPIDLNEQSIGIPVSGGVRQSKLTPVGVTTDYMFSDARTVVEILHRGQRISDNGPCLGWRENGSDYQWISYGEVIQRSKYISFGLVRSGMQRGQNTCVGIFAQNCVEWVLVEHACYCQSAVTVPLYASFGTENITYILNHVEAEIVVCDDMTKVQCLLDAKKELPKLKQIVAIKDLNAEIMERALENNVILHQLKDIEDIGRKNPQPLLLPSPSDLATICYTSGTTGNPKGVMITHANLVADASAFMKHLGTNYIVSTDRQISYLPLAHVLERVSQIILLSAGGSIGFFQGDLTLLIDDIRALKPTMIPTVPRVLNKIYDKIQKELNGNKIKKFLLNAAIKAKEAELKRGLIRNNSIWDHFVLKNIRNIFGGEVRYLLSSGAPLGDDVLTFFRCCMGCPVVQGYGMTEASAAITTNVTGEFRAGNVGPPIPCCFIKLIDVPEMNYYASKNEGEILVKGSNVTKGYFKDPVKTAETIDENGWLHTGDIGRWEKSGSLTVIDRKKNIFKLSQGEYVSPEKVESVYKAHPFVEQIFVHGNSLKSCLVAVICPEKENLLAWCSQNFIKGEWDEICRNEVVKEHVLTSLYEAGLAAGLKGFEQIKAIHLHPDVFTQQNGILTATMKIKREECQKQFKNIIDKMYVGLK